MTDEKTTLEQAHHQMVKDNEDLKKKLVDLCDVMDKDGMSRVKYGFDFNALIAGKPFVTSTFLVILISSFLIVFLIKI